MFSFSSNIFAATLSIADNLVLREFDDKRLNDGFFADTFASTKSIDLSKGRHTLLIKYKDVYEDLDFAEERLIESDFFIVKFTLAEQQTLRLKTPTIQNLTAAEKFAQAPEIILLDENNLALILQLEKYSDYKLAKQVEKVVKTLPVTSPDTELTKKRAEQVLVTNSNDTVVNPIKNASLDEEQAFNDQVLSQTKSLPMLKYWWQQASDKDKEDFILYMKGQ